MSYYYAFESAKIHEKTRNLDGTFDHYKGKLEHIVNIVTFLLFFTSLETKYNSIICYFYS